MHDRTEQGQEQRAAGQLLSTKLALPRLRPALVRRDALLARLDAGLEQRLTLISAPAGFGKTTLARAWVDTLLRRDEPPRVAWLALDPRDNDPVRFWRYLLGACQSLGPGACDAALAQLEALPFDTRLAGLALTFLLMALVGILMASLSYALALMLKDEGALAATLNSLMLPLLLLSGVMLPLTLAPPILQTLGDLNPFSHVVDAARALINGQLGNSSVPLGFGVLAVLAALAALWATRVFRKATA